MEGFQIQILKLLRSYEDMEQSMIGKQIELILRGIQHVMMSRASLQGFNGRCGHSCKAQRARTRIFQTSTFKRHVRECYMSQESLDFIDRARVQLQPLINRYSNFCNDAHSVRLRQLFQDTCYEKRFSKRTLRIVHRARLQQHWKE